MQLPSYADENQQLLSVIDRVGSVFAVPATSDTDARPHIKGSIEGRPVHFWWTQEQASLASPRKCSRTSLDHGPWRKFNPSQTSASRIDMEVFGRRITRPMYVLAGLQAHKAILGIDFVKEQQLVIDGDE